MDYLLNVVTHDSNYVFYSGAILDVDLVTFVVLDGRNKIIKKIYYDEVVMVRIVNLKEKKYRDYKYLDLADMGRYCSLSYTYRHCYFENEGEILS